MPEEGHAGFEVGIGGEDCVLGGTGGGCVEEEVGRQHAVDCAGLWESSGEGFGDCVGGAEGGEGDG